MKLSVGGTESHVTLVLLECGLSVYWPDVVSPLSLSLEQLL